MIPHSLLTVGHILGAIVIAAGAIAFVVIVAFLFVSLMEALFA